MSLDHNPQCSACKIANSLMWRRGSNGEILCNSCHLKRVNSSVRAQRQSSKESKKLIARIKAGTRKGWNGKSGERSRGRRSLQKMKRKPYKSPEGFATVVAADRIYYKGILYQAGDIVSIEDIEGDLYYAQLKGFLQDQYAQKTAVITWLLPVVSKPSHFDPALFLPGAVHVLVLNTTNDPKKTLLDQWNVWSLFAEPQQNSLKQEDNTLHL